VSSREPEGVLGPWLEGLAPEDAARALAQLISRAAARLHTLSRGEASARRAEPDWAAWAQLQNAARALVLQASTTRELAARLPTPPESAPPGSTPPSGAPPSAPASASSPPSAPAAEPSDPEGAA
jgi:hypothetical protein